jgi:hypothetical protein
MPSAFQSEAAYAYVKPETPVSTQWNAYPQLAAAGLWATPTGIAKLLIEVGNALANNGAVLTTASAVAVLSLWPTISNMVWAERSETSANRTRACFS